MTLRTYSPYTPQQVAEFARSYRKAEFLELQQEVLASASAIRPEDRDRFLAALVDTFDLGCSRPGCELLLFLWPTGEAAFLAVETDSLRPDVERQHGLAHRFLSSPCTTLLGLPDAEVVKLYRLRAGVSLGGWLHWDGWQLKYQQYDEAQALHLYDGRCADAF